MRDVDAVTITPSDSWTIRVRLATGDRDIDLVLPVETAIVLATALCKSIKARAVLGAVIGYEEDLQSLIDAANALPRVN